MADPIKAAAPEGLVNICVHMAKQLTGTPPPSPEAVAKYLYDCVTKGALAYALIRQPLPSPDATQPREQARADSPLRQCSYCTAWHSKPCGEGCVWSPNMPTLEDALSQEPNNEH